MREVEVRYPPPPSKRGISAILARYPVKTSQMGAIPPSAILSRKGIARYGGVSRTGPLSKSPRFPRGKHNWLECGEGFPLEGFISQISFEPGNSAYQGLEQKKKSAPFQDFLFLSAVSRVRGRFQNPRQTPVRSKLRLKTFSEFHLASDTPRGLCSLACRSFKGNTIRGNTTRSSERKMAL